MKIKIEIPKQDFMNWVAEIHKTYIDGNGVIPVRRKLRNQIVEQGNYIFSTEICQGYNHDSAKLDEQGKVSFTVEISPPD